MEFLKHRLLIWCKIQAKGAQLKMEVLVHASLEFQHQLHMNTCSVLSVPSSQFASYDPFINFWSSFSLTF